MKKLTILILLVQITSCDERFSGTELPKQDKAKRSITSAIWKISTVDVDGVDQTATFEGMTLVFTSTNYTTTKGGALWPPNGEWRFGDMEATYFIRSDGLKVNAEISDDKLVLTFVSTTNSIGGRLSSVKGNYTFKFFK